MYDIVQRANGGGMTEGADVLNLYEGFFSGGARIVHSDILQALHNSGQRHAVLAINSKMSREGIIQEMQDDRCYQEMTEAGIAIASLGRHGSADPDRQRFSADEIATFAERARGCDLLLSLKERPLSLLRQAVTSGVEAPPAIVTLHRSDPDNQGQGALGDLLDGINSGHVVAGIAHSQSTKTAYGAAGIPEHKLHVVTNGVDLTRYQPNVAKRQLIRDELGIPYDPPVIVFVARYDPAMKNPMLFLQSARTYLEQTPDAHVLMCGPGIKADNSDLCRDMQQAFANVDALTRRVHLLGLRHDMDAIYAAADIVALTSKRGEAYPLCLVEGLACDAIPVTTDVGDTKDIVGAGRGLYVPTDATPEMVANVWTEAYENRAAHLAAIHATRASFGYGHMIEMYRQLTQQYAGM